MSPLKNLQNTRLNIKKNGENVKLGHYEFMKKLKQIPKKNNRNSKDRISPTEITEIRQLISQLN